MGYNSAATKNKLFALLLWIFILFHSGLSLQYNSYFSKETNRTGAFPNDAIKLFQFEQPPRDAIQGFSRAIKTTVGGTGIGIAALIVCPLVGLTRGMKGLVMGVISGLLGGTALTTIGAFVGIRQIALGLVKTPGAIESKLKGKMFNNNKGEWEYYFLDTELRDLRSSFRNEHGSIDMEYYKLLQVSVDASPREIKKSYYRLAQQLHPDKNIDRKNEASEEFALLGKAYETLSDENLKKVYDKSGHTDVDIYRFIPKLLGLTTKMERYVGDLGICMFFDRIQTKKTMKMFEVMQKMREVNIGIQIRHHIEPFIRGHMNKEEFLIACRLEAEEVGRGDINGFLLSTIGMAIVLESQFFLSYHPIKLNFVSAWTRNKLHSIQQNIRIPQTASKAVVKAFGVVNSYNKKSSKKLKKEVFMDEKSLREFLDNTGELMDDVVPLIWDVSWSYILRDVSKTLKKACDKLFHDSTLPPSKWKERAQAVMILGEQFYDVGMEMVQDLREYRNQTMDDFLTQLEITYMILTNEAKGIRVSERDKEEFIEVMKKERSRRKKKRK